MRRRLQTIVAVSMLLAVVLLGQVPCHGAPHDAACKPGMTFDEFQKMWEVEGKTPEGAVKCLIVAVLEVVREQNQDGLRMWGLVLPHNEVDGNGVPSGGHRFALQQFARQIAGTDGPGAIAASYLGGSPKNKYAGSYDSKVVVDRAQTRQEGEYLKLFVRSGGKDSSSPVRLRRNNEGYWKIFEYSSLYTGVKPATDPGDF